MVTQPATSRLSTNAAALHITVFNIFWAIAHIGHLLRKEAALHPLVWILLLSCVLLIEKPSSRLRLGFVALSQIVLFIDRLPATDNHMYIMFFINAGLLVTVVYELIKDEGWNEINVKSIRIYCFIVLLISYGSAAIAKLNHVFFEPSKSCAVDMFGDAALFFGWTPAMLPSSIYNSLPFMVASTELLIPVLLAISRTRVVGIVLLVIFHIMISLSPTSTALDFTILLFAVAFLLLPHTTSEPLRAHYDKIHALIPSTLRATMTSISVLLLFFLLVALTWRLGTVAGNRGWALLAPMALTIGFVLAALATKSDSRQLRKSIDTSGLKLPHYALIGLLLFNVATPYMGIKTAGTFTMYSNLNTYDSRSNHFFLPRIPWRSLHDDLVEIVATSNEDLEVVRRNGLRVTWHELRRQLARTPESSISFIRDGQLYEYERADQNPELIRLHPVLHKIVWHRPDDSNNPRCLW